MRAHAVRLVGEPLERRVQDDEVTEQRAEDEQEHRDRERRDEPLALLRLERRQEERENLPEDDR